MARYPGKNSVVYISTTASGTATTIAGMAAFTLDMPTDKIEVSAFGDTNKTYVVGLKDVSGTLEGWFDDTDDNLYDAMNSGQAVKMYLYPSSSVTSKYFYGTAFVDFSIASGVGDGISVSGSFAAGGAWGQM